MNTSITSTSLYFREGNSDKEYHVAVEPEGEGYIVTYAYGRRGNTLTAGRKTQHIVSLAQANAIHDKLVRDKTAKGYQPAGEIQRPGQTAATDGQDSGIRCQLLNPIEQSEVSRLLLDSRHCLQEKHDGRRLMVRKQGNEITGINRRGLIVAIPDTIREAFEKIAFDILVDGEAIGDTLHAFDLLEVRGHCFRQRRYIDRFTALMVSIPINLPALCWISTATDPNDKVGIYEELRSTNCEGIVFKDMDAPYSPGRPNSGGPQLKFKFVETASFVVTGINTKRSVNLGLHDGNKLANAGNVTIPPNHNIPAAGDVVEVRYLYAFRESGSVYQPVYLGSRDDIPASECTVDQLKYKCESVAEV